MAKDKEFEDPLADVDPVMEEAYSSLEEEPQSAEAEDIFEDDIDLLDEEDLEQHDLEGSLDMPEFPSNPQEEIHDYVEHENAHPVSDIEFPALSPVDGSKPVESAVFSNIPVNVSVELGRSEITLQEVFGLMEGSIIELDRLVGEPLDLVVNGQIVAHGEVVAIDNNYGLRVTNIVADS